MNDITKYEFLANDNMGDANIKVSICDNISLDVELSIPSIPFEEYLRSTIYQKDAIELAKHFYSQLSTHDRIEYINAIRQVEPISPTHEVKEFSARDFKEIEI